jgi:hypothetical protein
MKCNAIVRTTCGSRKNANPTTAEVPLSSTAEKYVTCINEQHTFRVLPGSDADAKYKANQYLGPEECPVCNEDNAAYFRRHAHVCECYDDLCKTGKGCAYAQDLAAIPEAVSGLEFLPVQ